MTTGKTTALTKWTFVGKVMSLLFNMLSRLVIAFLPRNKSLWISWLQSLSAMILEPKKIKSATVSIVSPSICHEVMWLDAIILYFWMLSFKPAFSLSLLSACCFAMRGGVWTWRVVDWFNSNVNRISFQFTFPALKLPRKSTTKMTEASFKILETNPACREDRKVWKSGKVKLMHFDKTGVGEGSSYTTDNWQQRRNCASEVSVLHS